MESLYYGARSMVGAQQMAVFIVDKMNLCSVPVSGR